jgi:hypothetical protein
MVLTRKGWKEIKMGRLFEASCRVPVQVPRNEILQSLYVCHMGGHRRFLQKLEAYAEPYPYKVFIADGAKWIWTSGGRISTRRRCKSWTFTLPGKNWVGMQPCNSWMK